MTQTTQAVDRDLLDLLFGPATDAQTYVKLLYLLLGFPLGIAYFIFLIFGLSLGAGLVVIFIGIPILMGVFFACSGLGAFERLMARSMLHVSIAAPPHPAPAPGIWPKLKALFGSPTTWKSLFYLLLKFPFGVATFVVLVTAFSLSAGLILAPLTYGRLTMDFGFWQVSSKDEATVCCLVGVVLLMVSFHLVNGLAFVWGRFAQVMLGPDLPVGR
ncbi:MAG: sensor domain-containing protein [Acidobacteriia bacterium]|nr:sensor domain-containing protein [Terriglobia bacterium]